MALREAHVSWADEKDREEAQEATRGLSASIPSTAASLGSGLSGLAPSTYATFSAAATVDSLPASEKLMSSTTSMPFVRGSIAANAMHPRDISIDTGAEISAISAAAFARDERLLVQGAGCRVRELAQPIHMTLFDGSASTVSQVVMGAQVHVGDVVVTVNLMVVPTGGFEYLLGAPTLMDIGARIDLKGHKITMSTAPSVSSHLAPGATPPSKNFQTVQLFWQRRTRVMQLKPLVASR